nr:DNA replication ATP-dependent helicase Dna2 [Cryptococcus depauperatus CBS 7855]
MPLFGKEKAEPLRGVSNETNFSLKTRPVDEDFCRDAKSSKSLARLPASIAHPQSANNGNRAEDSHEKPNTQDEQALMDDILSGLDVSVLDCLPLPSKNTCSSQMRGKRQRSGSLLTEATRPTQRAKTSAPTMTIADETKPFAELYCTKKHITKVDEPLVKGMGKTSLSNSTVRKFIFSPAHQQASATQDSTTSEIQKVSLSASAGHKAFSLIKKEDQNFQMSNMGLVSEQKQSNIGDEDFFKFNYDLAELDYDEEALIAKALPPKTKRPIIHPALPPKPSRYAPTPWVRCVVDAVIDGLHFHDDKVPTNKELKTTSFEGSAIAKTLIVTSINESIQRIIHLKEQWADTPVEKDDIINIISPSLSNKGVSKPIEITFKDPSTYLIHHPDLMLTMTSIANAMPCPRKPILQALIKTPAPPTKPLLYGTLLHSLLQGALLEQDFQADGTFRRLDAELRKEERRLEIWSTGLDMLDIKDEVGVKAGRGFEVFEHKWVHDKPIAAGELHRTARDTPSLLSISGLHEVEEDIWSPKWGLKGKIDASVQAKIICDPDKSNQEDENVAPLEIKTGRAMGVMAHRAQTMLYTLLMEDRYGVPVPAGLLYYSQLDTILRVEAKQNEIRALIMVRNELVSWLSVRRKVPCSLPDDGMTEVVGTDLVKRETKLESNHDTHIVEKMEKAFLPPTIDNPRDCKGCYAVESCMLYRKVIDKVPLEEDNPIAELYKEHMGHMEEKDSEFYKKWDTLLTVEEQDTVKLRSQLWTMTAKEREKNGRCFSNMVVDSYSNDIGKSLSKIHRHSYTFIRASAMSLDGSSKDDQSSLLSGHISRGDPISLSIEPDLLCMWRGFVTELTQTTVTVAVTYLIDTDALLKRTGRDHRVLKAPSDHGKDKVIFRIDKDEMASGVLRMRNNLAQLFYKGGDVERRRLIVHQDPPAFESSWRPLPEEIPTSLNSDQRKAMESVLTARDYTLILGMPGTGKTSTIAEIIRALVNRGKSVLLTSYTHSAVDTILMKLADAEFGRLRLGNIDKACLLYKVHPDVQHLTLEALESSTSMANLDARLMKPPVVAATCLAIDHPIFFRRKFDYCIVDEASQITLPTCLGPLRMADKFVLVGDHFQLPPIVRHPEARRGGLDVSLFRHLSSAHPAAVVNLSYQYRMNAEIMTISNELIYGGRLKCGNEQVARQGLKLRHKQSCSEIFDRSNCSFPDGECWVQDLLKESAKCVFVDTDGVPALDSKVGDLVQNDVEAKLVYHLSTSLIASGIRQEDLAVITPYRQQVKLLATCFKAIPRVEILTADQSQGRDKDCIIVSLVRSNHHNSIGELLKDWRRINVSFTRAKKKLIIFASARTLGSDPLLKTFLQLVRQHGWEKRLKRGDDRLHFMNELASQVVVKTERKGRKVISGGKGVLKGRGIFTTEIMVSSYSNIFAI